MFAYIVNIDIDPTIYDPFLTWLKDHITGNKEKGIKGMLEIFHKDRPIYPTAELYATKAPFQGAYFAAVLYFADTKADIDLYLEQYADSMRSEMPETFKGKLGFSRVIKNVNRSQFTSLAPHNEYHLQLLHQIGDKLKLIDTFSAKLD